MKTTKISAIIVAASSLVMLSSCVTQVRTQTVVRSSAPATQTVHVEAMSDDISYNLDLRAVGDIFGASRNLEDFEHRLNAYDANISNLDLNNDGYIDYLRVVEMYENNVHLVVLQAVLDANVYQDVATLVVEKKSQSNVSIQIIGSSFLYGPSYIIQPVYYHTPVIYTTFWGPSYSVWSSPYYWGYYPTYYRPVRPVQTNIYVNNINVYVNNNNKYLLTPK